MKFRIKILLLVVSMIVGFYGCKGDNSEKAMDETPVKAKMAEALVIEDPWIRPASSGTNTALFFKVANGTNQEDTLYGAASELSDLVEVHETYQKGADMMGMRHVDQVIIPVGATIEFKPRDLHIMLIRLYDDLAISDSGTVVLMFKNAGEIKVDAIVRDMPMMSEMGH